MLRCWRKPTEVELAAVKVAEMEIKMALNMMLTKLGRVNTDLTLQMIRTVGTEPDGNIQLWKIDRVEIDVTLPAED
jgi:hypothetical protein